VVLSRDILGQIDVPDSGTASDDWVWDSVVTFKDGKPSWDFSRKDSGGVQDYNPDGSAGGLRGYGSGGYYLRADPSTWGKSSTPCSHGSVSSDGQQWMDNYDALGACMTEDTSAWKADQTAHEKSIGVNSKRVYIWNPSDNDAVQLNTDTYGALTKLFIKPTIPFKVSFANGFRLNDELTATLLSVFHPCPIRIETVQYDAVLQIGDFQGLNGTSCVLEEDTSSLATRTLTKQKDSLTKQITKLRSQLNVFNPNDSKNAPLNTKIAKLQTQLDGLKLPKKRVCTSIPGAADKLVIFIPLQINDTASSPLQLAQTKFINSFANAIPSILGSQPDQRLGYTDLQTATGSGWKLSDVLSPNDCYFTWKVPEGPSVIFMKNPASIFSADMASIQRLPITPPTDVFHSTPKDVRFHSCPPKNPDGTTAPCPGRGPPPRQLVPSAKNAFLPKNTNVGKDALLSTIIFGIISLVLVVLAVWLGIKFATGPLSTAFKGVGDWIGRTLAGKTTPEPAPKRTPPPPPKRTPPPPPKRTPPPPPKPTGLTLRTPEKRAPSLGKTNLLNETEDAFKARQRRNQQQGNTNPGQARVPGPAGTGLGGRREV